MNTIDFLLMLIFFCAIGFYAFKLHKKRNRARVESAKTDTPPPLQAETPDAQFAHLLAQALQNRPYPLGNMACNTPLTTAPNTMGITSCSLVSWTFRFDPLPFKDTDMQENAIDGTIEDDLLQLCGMLDSKIRSLNAGGYTVTGIGITVLPFGGYAARVLFCITCTGGTATMSDNRTPHL